MARFDSKTCRAPEYPVLQDESPSDTCSERKHQGAFVIPGSAGEVFAEDRTIRVIRDTDSHFRETRADQPGKIDIFQEQVCGVEQFSRLRVYDSRHADTDSLQLFHRQMMACKKLFNA